MAAASSCSVRFGIAYRAIALRAAHARVARPAWFRNSGVAAGMGAGRFPPVPALAPASVHTAPLVARNRALVTDAPGRSQALLAGPARRRILFQSFTVARSGPHRSGVPHVEPAPALAPSSRR